MGQYTYKKFKHNNGKKYVLTQFDGSQCNGPTLEHFATENITKIGLLNEEHKYVFDLSIFKPDGSDYSIKVCKDGYPNGPIIVMSDDTLYFGKFRSKDGFNGIVYRIKSGEDIRIQRYNHGVLVDECLFDHIIFDDAIKKLEFNSFYETENDVIEKKKDNKTGKFTEYIAGDPTSQIRSLAASIDSNNNYKIGQYKGNEFDGLVMDINDNKDLFTISFYDNGRLSNDFQIHYSSNPGIDGYSLLYKKDDSTYSVISYCKENNKYRLKIFDTDKDMKQIEGTMKIVPSEIDPDAPKPYSGINPKHKTKDENNLTAQQKLDQMIGLESVKEELKHLKAYIKKYPGEPPQLNMIFSGNPGTGKTVVARLIANILYDEGILPSYKLVEAKKEDLVAAYIGQTEDKTKKVIDSALGGVLFIDEAYTLIPSTGGDYGGIVIDQLVAAAENYKGKMAFIVAGYEDRMVDFINYNPGLSSRFKRKFLFKDFTKEQLSEIAKKIFASSNLTIDNDAFEEMMNIIMSESYKPEFGNARTVRETIDSLKELQAYRTADSARKDFNITMEDIQAYNKKDEPIKVDDLTAEERLNQMIGLSSVKHEIYKLKASIAIDKTEIENNNIHMVFYGNPGTGKSVVADLMVDILYDADIIKEHKIKHCGPKDMIAEYVGQTRQKTHKLIMDSLGGILFIDEAYGLFTNSKEYNYGQEAIDQLLDDMNLYKGKVCIILAGYEDLMDSFLDSNPGLRSRITRYLHFNDYTLDELIKISELWCIKNKMHFEDDAKEELIKVLEFSMKDSAFGNARGAENVLREVREIQRLRIYQEGIKNNTVTLTDVKEYEVSHGITFTEKVNKHYEIDINELIKISNISKDSDYIMSSARLEQTSVNIKNYQNGQMKGEGSGFFISSDGFIATNEHVIHDADNLIAIVNFKTITDEIISKEYKADIVTSDSMYDVAVIKITNSNNKFDFYPLALPCDGYPELLTEVAMSGYPFGGDRFEYPTITEGKIQSINIDKALHDGLTKIYLDIEGHPGSSGSGVINKENGQCISIFSGVAINRDNKIKYSMPIKYLWEIICDYCNYDINSITPVVKKKIFKNKVTINNPDVLSTTINKAPIFDNVFNIHVVNKDITTFEGDAIVNAANSDLQRGWGVCGAIFKAAGIDKLEKACNEIGHCDTGNAVITAGFDLKTKYILHAVGPRYYDDPNPERLLAQVYENTLHLAIKNNIKTIAFPSISTGIYSFPKNIAAPIAIRELMRLSKNFDDIYIYCIDDETYNIYNEIIKKYQ